jgi:plastocyanin
MKKVVVFPFLALLALLLVACSGGAKPEPVSYTIEMTEYAFTPATLELKVGQEVTLNLVNKGNLQHEVMFGREVKTENNRPFGYQQDMFAVGGVTPSVTQSAMPEESGDEMEPTGFMVGLPVGGQATMKFTVTKDMVGDWEMGCFEQDGVHYDAGMKGTVSVTQ